LLQLKIKCVKILQILNLKIKFKEKIMANIKSAKKRISTIERRTAENKFVKATLSTYVKKFRKMLEEGKIAEAETFSKELYSYIDSACSKGVIHKNAASRKVGRLAAALYKAKVENKPAKVEKVEKVEEKKEEKVEEVATEKKTTKRTTTKKATEEKPAAKKTTTKKATTKKAE
jgi:small subunit ribosomal protein S20